MTPTGLSPRARGNLRGRRSRGVPERSIPASAGEPGRAASLATAPGVYPRERGGTAGEADRGKTMVGLSPRARGNRLRRRWANGPDGSIPASAGEPGPELSRPPRAPVYPRERGGPRHGGWPAGRSWVYPRECGGTIASRCRGGELRGLSPRARGNLAVAPPEGERRGSIPASAGEPPPRPAPPTGPRVYPRERGGTAAATAEEVAVKGLSPRARGNPASGQSPAASTRSIPASAGQPRFAQRGLRQQRVYPRERGGTSASRASP